MHPEKLDAFVLSHHDYGERDVIASLFTLEHGRLKGFARSARTSRKRFGPALTALARIEVQIDVKEGLSLLRSADVIAMHSGIRNSLDTIAHGLYACELLEALTPEGVPLPRLYRLMAAYLGHLECGTASPFDRRMFEVNLLNILGYRPSLEQCSRCGTRFDNRGALLQADGELVCRWCAATGRTIEPATLSYLIACLATSRFGNPGGGTEILYGAGALLDDAIAAHSSRTIKSLTFLNQTCPL